MSMFKLLIQHQKLEKLKVKLKNFKNNFFNLKHLSFKKKDLCASVKCDNGERCTINENEAICECIESCEIPNDERQKVCK